MDRLPFEKLRDSMQFQKLCIDILEAEGCNNARGLGTGSDQGSDIMIEIPVNSPLGTDFQSFIVQCKWYTPNNNVGQDEVLVDFEYLDLHNAIGLLFITSSHFSGTAVTKMNSLDRSSRNPYQVKFWDGHELTKRLRKYPELIARYWHSKEEKQKSFDEPPTLHEIQQFLSEYRFIDPGKFANFTMESFPKIPGNEQYVDDLRRYFEEFTSHSPVLTILEGAIGAGKTGFAWVLMNQKRVEGYEVAEIRPQTFQSIFFEYKLLGDNRFPAVFSFFKDVDILLLDNLDRDRLLLDKSDTQQQFANVLVDLVKYRIEVGKLSIISVVTAEETTSKPLQNYLHYLKKHYPVVYVGNESMRPYLTWDGVSEKSEGLDKTVSEKESEPRKPMSKYLGKSWLIEKYEDIEKSLERGIDILVTPEDIDEANRQRWREVSGEYQTREESILDELRYAKRNLIKYRDFVSGCQFRAIRFGSDGEIELIED